MTRPLTVARWHPRLRDRIAGVTPATAAAPVTFPTTNLVTRVQIALGADLSADPSTWNWLDITEWVRYDLGISVTTGRRDEATQVTTGSAQLKLDNRDGRFVRRNPTGPYYGLLSKNTPIWITIDAGSGEKTRLEMFVNEWPTRWSDQSANDSTVTIRCAGVLRRLAQGLVLKSALRRVYLSNAQPTLAAYWPCEDENGSETVGSGISSSQTPLSGLVPVFTTGIDGSTGALDLVATGAGLSATVALPSAAGFQVEFAARGDQGEDMLLFEAFSGAYVPVVALNGTLADDGSHHVAVRFEQSGGNVLTTVWQDGVFISTTSNPTTLGNTVTINTHPFFNASGNPATGTLLLAHLAIYGFDEMSDPAPRADAADGFDGESAHDRISRLCEEEGIPCETHASDSASMGPQSADSLLGLIQEAAAADLGALYEKRWGLGYRALTELYNQDALMAVDFATYDIAELPEPADDDQRTRNLWTVSRPNGSEATAEESTGPMGTGAQGPGVYDDSVTVNVAGDDQLAQQAGWRVHLGTIDEDRWPNIGLNFARRPALIDAFAALPFGARITAANPLSPYVDDLDLIVEGHSERWDQFLWLASLNCSPASAYRVFVVGSTSANVGRVDAANSTLAADATSVATSLSVASPAALWRTGAVNFDINVAGERMTVTNIAGGSSPQTFTVSRSVNGVVKAQSAVLGGISTKVSLWSPYVVALWQ